MSAKEKGTTRHDRFDDAVKGKRSYDIKYAKGLMILGIIILVGIIAFRAIDFDSIQYNLSQLVEDITIDNTQVETLETDDSSDQLSEEKLTNDPDEKNEEIILDESIYNGPLQVGLTMEEVEQLLGQPYLLDTDSGDYRYWYYANDDYAGEYYPTISFDVNGVVDGWYNYDGWFDDVLLEPSMTGDVIRTGITVDEVYVILGTPDFLEGDSPMFLWYGDMYIELSEENQVIGWRFRDHSTDEFFELPSGGLGDLSVGILESDVTKVLGAPNDLVLVEDEVIWLYGDSSITFSLAGQVIGWYDEGDLILMRKVAEGDNSQLSEGMSYDEVTTILGTPVYTFYEESNLWGYDTMYVEFDLEGRLSIWGPWSE